MAKPVRIAAIVGSYRKGGIIDQAVDQMLDAAGEAGAEVTKIYLVDTNLEFCTNCRVCTQQAGAARGICPIMDEMSAVLDRLENSDAIVLASPVNFGTVTAIMKRFIERLACYAYWPWGKPAPEARKQNATKRAVLVASCAAPAFLARLMTPMAKLLKKAAAIMGARTVGILFIGLAARERVAVLRPGVVKKARLLGKELAGGGV